MSEHVPTKNYKQHFSMSQCLRLMSKSNHILMERINDALLLQRELSSRLRMRSETCNRTSIASQLRTLKHDIQQLKSVYRCVRHSQSVLSTAPVCDLVGEEANKQECSAYDTELEVATRVGVVFSLFLGFFCHG